MRTPCRGFVVLWKDSKLKKTGGVDRFLTGLKTMVDDGTPQKSLDKNIHTDGQ